MRQPLTLEAQIKSINRIPLASNAPTFELLQNLQPLSPIQLSGNSGQLPLISNPLILISGKLFAIVWDFLCKKLM